MQQFDQFDLLRICFSLMQNYQRHLTSKSYDHEDFGRLGVEDDGLPLEQVRDAPEADLGPFEQSLLAKRMGRKRKAQDEVTFFVSLHIFLFSLNFTFF